MAVTEIQIKHDVNSIQDGSNESDSGLIFKEEPTGFPGRWYIKCKTEREKEKSRKLSKFLVYNQGNATI
jgi:hypothetical protein